MDGERGRDGRPSRSRRCLTTVLAASLITGSAPFTQLARAQAPPDPSEAGGVTVLITGDGADPGFEPADVTVAVGDTVHWTNVSSTVWQVIASGGLLDSGPIPPGGAFSATLTVPGAHPYSGAPGGEPSGNVRVLATRLDGPADGLANDHIPDLIAPPVDDYELYPPLAVEASTSRITVGFTDDATVADANEALAQAHVGIIAGMTTLDLIEVRVPQDDFAGVEAALTMLERHPAVEFATMEFLVESKVIPRAAENETFDQGWVWNVGSAPHGANWGLEAMRAPHAWNLREAIQLRGTHVTVAVIDGGFQADHPDLPIEVLTELCGGGECLPTPNGPRDHGTHVAGTIAAAFANPAPTDGSRARGVDGIAPDVDVVAVPERGYAAFDKLLAERATGGLPNLRLINYSMGPPAPQLAQWWQQHPDPSCGPGTHDDHLSAIVPTTRDWCTPANEDGWLQKIARSGAAARRVAERAGALGVTIVQAGGNESARFCRDKAPTCAPAAALPLPQQSMSDFGWAAANWVAAAPVPIIMVEAHDIADATGGFSNRDGDISAPGASPVLSTITGGGYGVDMGTSMAAPHVTGAAAMLLAFDPSLSADDLRQALRMWGRPPPTRTVGASFTWRVADRTGIDADLDGLVDDVELNDSDLWPVEVDACLASVTRGTPVGRYQWTVDGVAAATTTDCRTALQLNGLGAHTVELTVIDANGDTSATSQTVDIRDVLIFSIGDSVASGEGVPDIAADAGTNPPTAPAWQDEQCHRSAYAGPAQAARWLESADPRSSVSFVHLACSGARISSDEAPGEEPDPSTGGLLTPYQGIIAGPVLPPQVDEVDRLAGGRDIDALMLSIGANDLTFSSIITRCAADPFCDDFTGKWIYDDRSPLLPPRYELLGGQLDQKLGPDLDTHVTTYFDPTRPVAGGAPSLSCFLDAGLAITADEALWAAETVVAGLNGMVTDAASNNGWHALPGIPLEFDGHGYCAEDHWIVQLGESRQRQGDVNGAFHPNFEGHRVYARHLVSSLLGEGVPVTPTAQTAPPDHAPRLDLFAALLNLPGAVKALVDVNDASLDGNRRIERRLDEAGDVVEEVDDHQSEVAGHRTAPDGFVDLRDFRRFRDAWIQSCLYGDERGASPDTYDASGCMELGNLEDNVLLDGEAAHPKKDLNFDGCTATAGDLGCLGAETTYSRFDFNGDGLISITDAAPVPLRWTSDDSGTALVTSPAEDPSQAARMTDLQLLESQWTSDLVAPGDLEDLMLSADLEVHVESLFQGDGVTSDRATVTVVDIDSGEEVAVRSVRAGETHEVITVPVRFPGSGGSADAPGRFRLTAELDGTDRRAAAAEVGPLRFGEDVRVDLCAPHLAVRTDPSGDLPADGQSQAIVSATIETCEHGSGIVVEDRTVSFTLAADDTGDATLSTTTDETNADGLAVTTVQASTVPDTYRLTAAVTLDEGIELETTIAFRTVAQTVISYVWRQQILEWVEEGTTRWGDATDTMPDCTFPGVVEYCIDRTRRQLLDDASNDSEGFGRTGTVRGIDGEVELVEELAEGVNWARIESTLTDPDGSSVRGQEVTARFGIVPAGSGGTVYADEPLDGAHIEDLPAGVLARGLGAIGELGYVHSLTGVRSCPPAPTGCVEEDIDEVGWVTSQLLLVPRGDGSAFTYARDLERAVPFERRDDGGFVPYQACVTVEHDLVTAPGYRIADPADWIPGANDLSRDPTYDPGDRPMPVGPGRLVLRYAIGAVAHQGPGEPPAPDLPECDTWVEPEPEAAFTVEPAAPGEGRMVHLVADPFRTVNAEEFAWDLGDGTTSTGPEVWHRFDDDGTYTVSLTTTDGEGRSAVASDDVVVENLPPEVSIDEATGSEDAGVILRFRVWDPGEVDQEALEYTIGFDDPSVPDTTATESAGMQAVLVSSIAAGTYEVTVTVTDKDGAEATDTVTVVVEAGAGSGGGSAGDDGGPGPGSGPWDVPCGSLDPAECAFLLHLNQYRMQNGLTPLHVSELLTQAATGHAADMASNDFFDHTGSDGRTAGDRAADAGYTATNGENIFGGSANAMDALVEWKTSDDHNTNMLRPEWRVAGVARVQGEGELGWYWVNTFGTAPDPDSSGAATTALLAAWAGPEERTPEPVRARPEERTPDPVRAGGEAFFRAATTGLTAAAALDDLSGPRPPVAALRVERLVAAYRAVVAVANRSRGSAGGALGATVDWGDGSDPEVVAADAAVEHVFPSGGPFTITLTATDDHGTTSVSRTILVEQVAPVLTWTGDVGGASAADVLLAVRATAPDTGDPIEGLAITLALGTLTHSGTTDADGRLEHTVALDLPVGTHSAEASFAGDDHWIPAVVSQDFPVTSNGPPSADAGGPYLVVAGNALALDGSGSTDPDAAPDQIASYDWDLDDDGVFGEVTGATPIVSWSQLQTLMCAGECEHGSYPIALRVTDTRGARDVATTVVDVVADFTLFVTPAKQALVPGQINSFTVSVVGLGGFDDPVELSVSGLPEGVTATFDPPTVVPTGVASLRLEATEDADTGEFELEVTGNGGGLTRNAFGALQVSFGLVPICYGVLTGTVTDSVTGEPVSGVRMFGVGHSDTFTDADGRYAVPQFALGPNNQPRSYFIEAYRPTDYWTLGQDAEALCGATTVLDFAMIRKRVAHVSGEVVVGQPDLADPSVLVPTDVPIGGARIEFGTTAFTTTAADGSYTSPPLQLNTDNAPRFMVVKAKAAGHWPATATYTATADDRSTRDFALRAFCYGHITGGRFLEADDGSPIAGAAARLTVHYPDSSYLQHFSATTDAEGRYHFGIDVPLGPGNGQVTYIVQLSPPFPSPSGSYGTNVGVTLTGCGATAGAADAVGHVAQPPVQKYGSLEGVVTDEESGEPVPAARVCGGACVTADENGHYEIPSVFVATWQGNSRPESRVVAVTVNKSGYWSSSTNATVVVDQTTTLDLELLQVHYGRGEGTVRDAVTGLPLEGAHVCIGFCGVAGADGRYVIDRINLGPRNSDALGFFNAGKSGYWNQQKTATVGAAQTTFLDFELVEVCEAASVAGVVVNAVTLEPIPGASVNHVTTDALGRFEIRNIGMQQNNQSWTYFLTASAPGFLSQTKPVTVFCGARITIDFGKPQTATSAIVGTVTDADSGAPLAGVFVGGGFGGSTTTDADGNYRLDDVPLGADNAPRTWEISALPTGYDPQTRSVTVSRDEEARLDFAFSRNRPPRATGVVVSTDEDTPVDVVLVGTDADGDPVTFAVVTPPLHGTLTGSAPDLRYTPDRDYWGADQLTFRVNDGTVDSSPAAVMLDIAPVDDLPALDPLDDVEVTAGAVRDVAIRASDVDGDAITVEATGLPPFASFTDHGDGTATITLAPGIGHAGSHGPVTVVAASGGEQVSETFNVLVTASNRPPVAAADVPEPAHEGATIRLDASSSTDPDGDLLAYRWDIDGTTYPSGVVELRTTDDVDTTAELTVTDPSGATDTLQVPVVARNVAPSVDAGPDRAGRPGTTLQLTADLVDPGTDDTHTATVDWGDGTTGAATVDGDRVLASHTYTDIVAVTAEICVTDDDGGVGCDQVLVDITPAGPPPPPPPPGDRGPRAPDLAPLADLVVEEGRHLVVEVRATDANGDHLALTAADLPPFARFEDHGGGYGGLTVRPGFEDAGVHGPLTITASDGGATDTVTVLITVVDVNRPPVAVAGGPYVTDEGGEPIRLDGSRSLDPDGGALSLAWVLDGRGLEGPDPVVPATDDRDGLAVLTVTDAEGGQETATVRVIVRNVPPAVQDGTEWELDLDPVDGTLTIVAGYRDVGAADTHTATVDWGGGALPADIADGIVTATLQAAPEGPLTVRLCVSDDDGGVGCGEARLDIGGVEVLPRTETRGDPLVRSGAPAQLLLALGLLALVAGALLTRLGVRRGRSGRRPAPR